MAKNTIRSKRTFQRVFPTIQHSLSTHQRAHNPAYPLSNHYFLPGRRGRSTGPERPSLTLGHSQALVLAPRSGSVCVCGGGTMSYYATTKSNSCVCYSQGQEVNTQTINCVDMCVTSLSEAALSTSSQKLIFLCWFSSEHVMHKEGSLEMHGSMTLTISTLMRFFSMRDFCSPRRVEAEEEEQVVRFKCRETSHMIICSNEGLGTDVIYCLE